MPELSEYTLCFLERFIHSVRSPLSVSSTLFGELLAGYDLEKEELQDCKTALNKALDLCRYLELSLALARENREELLSLLSRLTHSAPPGNSRFEFSRLEDLLNAALKYLFNKDSEIKLISAEKMAVHIHSTTEPRENPAVLIEARELLQLDQTLEMAALVFILASAGVELKAERTTLISQQTKRPTN